MAYLCIKKITTSLIFQVILSLGAGFLLAPFLPFPVMRFFYALSGSIKDLLVFFLPLVIISYLVSSLIAYEERASKVIIGTLLGTIFSIFLALIFSFFIGRYFFPSFVHVEGVQALHSTETLIPLWTLPLQSIPTDTSMILAVIFGVWFNLLRSPYIVRLRNSHYHKLEYYKQLPVLSALIGLSSFGIFATSEQLGWIKQSFSKLRNTCEHALIRLFIPLVPLYIFGFILKISTETSSVSFLQNFWKIFLFNGSAILLYVLFFYWVVAGLSLVKVLRYLKNMFPATLTGFSTMSSVATMPLTLQGTERNMDDQGNFAQFIIPTTVNVHAIGDVINIALSGLALLLMSNSPLPNLTSYLCFAFYTCLAQFSCVSVPGGGIIVMTVILQKYLGLSIEATLLLTSIYFLQEPFLTAANVTYNGAFAIGLKKLLRLK